MRRGRICVSLAMAAAIAAACGDSKSGNPTAPTTPTSPAASVRSIVVSSSAASGNAFQMTAKAELSDGTAKDVTTTSQWDVSDTNLATVSQTGMLTVIHSGHVDVRASYQQVTGTLGMTLEAPHATFALSGIAQETPPTARPLAGVTVTIVQGPDTGRSATSDSFGMFRMSGLQPAVIGAEGVKDGYLVWRIMNLTLNEDRDVSVLLYPTPPKDTSGVSATARCNDATWSWASTRAEACAMNGGIAYTVCPGPLCQTTVAR